jgi:membrane-bound metal-dependent hydrolase YbcI (DUF457 family)
MANWKGHVGGAIVLGGAYAGALSFVPVERFAEASGVLHDWQAVAAILVLSILFGLFPDVDTNSKGQNIFFGFALAVDILLIWSGNIQAAAYLGLVAMLPVVGKHRGWTHSKLAMFLVPLPILLIPYLYNSEIFPISIVYYGAAVTGYFSHLLLDGLIVKWFRIKTSVFAD